MEITIKIETQQNPIARVMEVFYEINPMLNWGNKTYRKACEQMIKHFGADETVAMARQIIAIQGEKYAPTATNPYQMKEKLSQFQIYFKKHQPTEEFNGPLV